MQAWDEEYSCQVDALEALVDKIKHSPGSGHEKDAILADIVKVTEKIKNVKKSFGLELKMIKDRNIKSDYEVKARGYEGKVSSLLQQLEGIKSQYQSIELMSKTNQNQKGGRHSTEGKGNDDLLQEASKIQDDTMSSLSRTKGMIEASKEIGNATLEILQKQREQIAEIDHEITSIDSNMKRARILVKNFSRRMAGDRIIQIFTALNIVMLIVVVIYVIVSGRTLAKDRSSGSSNVDDDGNT